MSDFREKLRSKLFRGSSSIPTSQAAAPSSPSSTRKTGQVQSQTLPRQSPSARVRPSSGLVFGLPDPAVANGESRQSHSQAVASDDSPTTFGHGGSNLENRGPAAHQPALSPLLTVESPTPDSTPPVLSPASAKNKDTQPHPLSLPIQESAIESKEPERQEQILKDTPSSPRTIDTPPTAEGSAYAVTPSKDYFGRPLADTPPAMSRRKVWIKRAGASPTLVQIAEDDLVDDMRDMVLRKYSNSLGRNFDAPDVSIRIVPRERSQQERVLGPEEPIIKILEACFPGGQTIEEALLIDVPRKRTPLPSPRITNYNSNYLDDGRPLENGTGYFPPMPASSPHPSQSATSHDSRHSHQDPHPHSIAVLETGQLPVLPSPREKRSHHRPKFSRHHTSSPTYIAGVPQPLANAATSAPRQHSSLVDAEARRSIYGNTAQPLPTPPAAEAPSKAHSIKASTPPLDRFGTPQTVKPKKPRKGSTLDTQQQQDEQPQQQIRQQQQPQSQQQQHLQGGDVERKNSHAHHQPPLSLVQATVPPINVLIVEDNPINLRLLEMFTKRLKVRWSTAMNGRDAVTKWRAGGFHLVLMDIQLPIMSGLEATKEIRRLERVNGIGVFARTQQESEQAKADARAAAKAGEGEGEGEAVEKTEGGEADNDATGTAKGDDKLSDDELFKSPVIIVALTASSLQSDRHEALAAGCNDFLTKPVSFPWLERKVMEWGCMQALIDFDGWRKWKDLAAEADEEKKKEEEQDPELKAKREKREAKRAAIMAKMGQG